MSFMDGLFGSQTDYTTHTSAHVRELLEMEKAKYLAAMQAQDHHLPVERFNPNKNEAFNAPMSQLVTLWRIKHGDEWVDMQRPRPPSGKDFYTDAFDRLDRANMFEVFGGWYRLKEDV